MEVLLAMFGIGPIELLVLLFMCAGLPLAGIVLLVVLLRSGRQEMAEACPHCGSRRPAGAMFCPTCGKAA